MKTRCGGLAILCVLASLPCDAQERHLRFDHLSVEQGLSNAWVQSILKDSRGFLWFGTQDGLNRYDGAGIKIYWHDPSDSSSLPSSVAAVVFEDGRKRLWVGSGWGHAGLALYDREHDRFKSYLPNPGQALGNDVRAMVEDRQGQLWLGTDNGIAHLDPEKGGITRFPMVPDSRIGTQEAVVVSLFADRQDRLWVGTNAGLLRFDRRRGQYVRWPGRSDDLAGLNRADIWDFYEDEEGGLWVATLGGGLHRVDVSTGRETRYLPDPRDPDSIGHARVRRLVPDGRGKLYVGTENGGLDILGDLWIGTDGGGLNHLDRKTGRFTYYRHNPSDPNSLGSDAVLALLEDRQQNIWIGTWAGGLHRLDPRTGRIDRFPRGPDLPFSLAEWTIVEDAQGNLLLGRYGTGVEVLDPKTAKYTLLSHVYPGVYSRVHRGSSVVVVIEDAQERLWLGGTEGLDVVDRKSGHVEHHAIEPENPQSLVPGEVLAIRPDSRGNVWIGTEHGGLTCLEAGSQRVRRYTHADGLPHRDVGDILEDDEGNLWLGTPHGLVKFENGVSLPEKPRFVVFFDVHDGLQGYEFRHGAAFKSRTGEMFFGGELGLNYFWPKDVRQNPMVPPVVLTDLRIFNKSVAIGAPHSPLKKAITEISELMLSYRQSVVTFQFAALNFVLPQKNLYKYKLEGFDGEWNEVGTQHTATYMNLPHGRYTFRVQASNNDGVWNEEGASLRLLVMPPFWKTWWFTAALGVVLVTSIVGSYRLRVRQHVRAERELQARVTAAMADIRTLRGLLPICAWCKKVRDDSGYWSQIEEYVSEHSEAAFSHGICPECRERHLRRNARDEASG